MPVDSGSLILWLESDAGYPADSSKLTKAIQTDGTDSFLLQYGIGNVSGTLYYDNITLSGTDVKVTNLTIGSANETSSNFVGDEAKGVLGLGFAQVLAGLAARHPHRRKDKILMSDLPLAEETACANIARWRQSLPASAAVASKSGAFSPSFKAADKLTDGNSNSPAINQWGNLNFACMENASGECGNPDFENTEFNNDQPCLGL